MDEREEKLDGKASEPGPAEFNDPRTSMEIRRAIIWVAVASAVLLIGVLAQSLLIIFGGCVVAAILDGGTRLLGRILPIPRGFRLTIVLLLTIAFAAWLVTYTGSELVRQAQALQTIVESQFERINALALEAGLTVTIADFRSMAEQALAGIGQFTQAVTTVFGAISSIMLILVLGIFFAIEPHLYQRGVAWMVPRKRRDYFHGTAAEMGRTLRRLMAGRLAGMAIEGIATWLLLLAGGVPMAFLLGVLTGLLVFIPYVGALVSGVLIIIVGFSAGVETGLYAVAVYVIVQGVDGYLIVPLIAKKSVDLPPALVLGAQIIFGALFGILGIALADSLVAMIKTFLERQSRYRPNGDTPTRLEGH